MTTKPTHQRFQKTWLNIFAVTATLLLLLFLSACDSNTANQSDEIKQSEVVDLNTEEGQRMDANSKFLVENLPMISFSYINLYNLVESLETEGAKEFVSAEAKNEIDSENELGPHAFIDIVIKDSSGDIFTVHISVNGYYSDFLVQRVNGETYAVIHEPPIT